MAAAHELHPPVLLPPPLLLVQQLPQLPLLLPLLPCLPCLLLRLLRVAALPCCCREELQLPFQGPLLLLMFFPRLENYYWLQFVHLLLLLPSAAT